MFTMKELNEYLKKNSKDYRNGYLQKFKPSPYWHIVFKQRNGKMTSITTGEKDKEKALEVLNNFIEEQKAKSRAGEFKAIKLEDFKTKYTEYLKGRDYSHGSKITFRVSFGYLIDFFGKEKYLDNITIEEMEKFMAKLKGDKGGGYLQA